MRYFFDEEVILIATYYPDREVKVRLIDLAEDKIFIEDTAQELKSKPGVYKYDLNNIQAEGIKHFYFEFFEDDKVFANGKVIFGGKDEHLLNELYLSQFGDWEIKNANFIIKDKNGNEIARFALLDKYGEPTEGQVFKRVRIDTK